MKTHVPGHHALSEPEVYPGFPPEVRVAGTASPERACLAQCTLPPQGGQGQGETGKGDKAQSLNRFSSVHGRTGNWNGQNGVPLGLGAWLRGPRSGSG